MKAVCNASPLIILGRMDRLELLPALFGVLNVAHEVFIEVAGAGNERPVARQVQAAAWLVRHPALPEADLAAWRRKANLGAGELATIALAKRLSADWVILDERLARALAQREGLGVMGCVGLLEAAYRRGLVTDLRAEFQRLKTMGAYIAPSILQQSLAACGLAAK